MNTRLQDINDRIHAYEKKYQRTPGSVSLLAASKSQSIETIRLLYENGQRLFGENYLQEALKKMSLLSDCNIEWHFIGPIQSNKTRKIAEHFTWVQSVANSKIAQRLNDQRPIHLPPLNICIEVNVSEEISKSGAHLNEVLPLATYCQALPNLVLRGLMAIPAAKENFIDQRKEFHKLATLFSALREKGFSLDTLSMGMTHDFEAAIAEGATIIRVGTGLFGLREK